MTKHGNLYQVFVTTRKMIYFIQPAHTGACVGHTLRNEKVKENLGGKKKLNGLGRQQADREIFRTVGEACMTIFCPSPGFGENR